MAMVCSSCGMYVRPSVNSELDTLTCPECRHTDEVRLLPLFIVTGASGVGKTSVVSPLRRMIPEFDVFETDIIWDADWQRQRNNWLRIAYSIAQSGRGSILCGTMMPGDIEQCDYFPMFRRIHYLCLHCDNPTRESRLRARPAWRNSGTPEFIDEHARFAQWLLDHADTDFHPPLRVVDSTRISAEEVAEQIRDWVLSNWP